MYTVKKITTQDADKLEFVYNDFFNRSYTDYGYEILPLEFSDIKNLIPSGFLNILALFENDIVKGFLIYSIVVDVVEISVIHCVGEENIIAKKDALIKALLEEVKDSECKIISYAMMGIQKDFVVNIAKYGFDFVGQAIVNFKFDNEKSMRIFSKVKDRPVPEGFEVVNWDDKYALDMVKLIFESFKNMQDQKFDLRFKTLEGCEDIVYKITKNIYGIFLPEKTKVLLENGVPRGFCFVNLTTDNIANIPLIGISPELKYKGMGQLLLTKALYDVLQSAMKREMPVFELNATVDTDNLPAINMYRKLGFKESVAYPQAYCVL